MSISAGVLSPASSTEIGTISLRSSSRVSPS
jgi:hypothetical protein